MMRRASYERELLEALRVPLANWRQKKSLSVLLTQPPWNLPANVKVTERRIPLLRSTGRRRQPPMLARWPELGLHASQYPYMGCVIEGEADLCFGVTREMAKSIGQNNLSGSAVLTMPAGTFFMVAPGVPYPDGSHPHWERPHLENAASRILWLSIYPTGLALHSCTTQGENHQQSSSVFVWDARALTISTLLIEALQVRAPQANEIAQAHLATLLLRAEQEWLLGKTSALQQAYPSELDITGIHSATGMGHLDSIHQSTVHRACDYIESHVAADLTLEDIAAHAFVSVAHLNRLFRAELQMSVMEFVTQKRIQTSQFLLRESQLSINHITVLAGFKRSNYFSRVFYKHTGSTPSDYRKSVTQPE